LRAHAEAAWRSREQPHRSPLCADLHTSPARPRQSTRIDSFFGEWDKPKAQLLLWLLDLQAQFVMNHEHNRMTAKNMGTQEFVPRP